ncbi:HDOD domain-containing protein [Idiomarina sp. HP20-50]|uniref:HDOD domain-containing protein n=1 Tax=Idiomarina sp. HP20-50 TaxID=3070813 RepID=UPI00294B907B|nr:HDOD domain-containing protein [Idiomarina sp. HP20-50]MDV6317124.1 HDOD domain-containing protein [Idiomarina sp. HP20-50]
MAIEITTAEKQLLQRVSIPPRPQTLLTVSSEAKKDEPDVAVIAQSISADMSIAAAVLQVVNSAAYRRAKEVDSIQQAVMTLGFRRVFPIVRAVALKSALTSDYDLNEFWRYNEWVASACVLVAESIGRPELRDHAYMLGLFQSSGIPVMLTEFEDYADLLNASASTPWPKVQEQELKLFNTTHTTIGALLAQQWKLPKIVVEVIYYLFEDSSIFTHSNELDSLTLDLLGILKIARYSVDMRTRSLAGEEEWQQVQDGVLEHFQIDEFKVEDIMQIVHEELFDAET